MSSKYRIIPLGGGGMDPSTKYGASISMSMDQDYILSVQLLDQDGNALGSEQTVDLPLESVVVGGSYDSATKSLILTLDNGNTVTIPVGDLVSGLQTEITAQNPLSADLVADGTNNKVFTAAEQTKLSGIEAGAQVNVNADWNAQSGAAQILNKPNIPAYTGELINNSGFITINDVPAQVNADWDASSGAAQILNKPNIPAAANDATITVHQDGQADQTFTLNQSGDQTINIAAGGGGNAWYGTQAQFDALGTYDDDTDYFISDKIDYNTDLKNKPNLGVYATKIEVKTKNNEQDAAIAGKMSGKFMTQAEFDLLGQNILEGENYFIEGNTVQMDVIFQDQTTATYNVVID